MLTGGEIDNMDLRRARRRLAFQHLLDEVDAAARAVELVAEQLVRGAGRGSEAAVHALAQDGVGLAAFGGAGEFGGEGGLHGVSRRRAAPEPTGRPLGGQRTE